MSPDRPGTGGDERDDEFTEMLDPVPPGTLRAARLPQQDTTGVVGYVAGTGPAAPRRPGVLQRASRGATADGEPLCR
jgi:hypothetical protein